MEVEGADLVQLNKLAEEAGLDITYDNGQRSLGPPKNWTGEAPPRGTEIHIGRLPRHLTEEDLFPLFAKCGTIYTFRLMLSSSGDNRGYCFAKYATLDEANAAIKEMDGHLIDGKPIRVQRSVENQKLFIRPLPLGATAMSIYEELNPKLSGIIRVTIHPNSKSLEEQYAFLEFADHKTASLARRRILERKASYNGTTLYVDWALPAENKNLPRTLRIRNANPMTKEEDFKQLLNSVGNNGLLTLAFKKKYVQAQFDTFDNAQAVINKMHGCVLDGNLLVVNWKRGFVQRMNRPYYTKLGPDFFQVGQFNANQHIAMPVIPCQYAPLYPEAMTKQHIQQSSNTYEPQPDIPLVQFVPASASLNAVTLAHTAAPPSTSGGSTESSPSNVNGNQFRGSFPPQFGVFMQPSAEQQNQNSNVVYHQQQQPLQTTATPTFDQQILYTQLLRHPQQAYDQNIIYQQPQGLPPPPGFEHVVYAQPAPGYEQNAHATMYYTPSGPARIMYPNQLYHNVPQVIDYNRSTTSTFH